MKKVLLLICTVLVALATFAQSRMAEMPNQIKKYHINNVVTNTPVSVAAVVPFWEDDFSDATNWDAQDLLNGGLQNWVITTNGPVGPFSAPLGAIASTTAANGFALYDSDAMNANYTTPQDAVLTYKGTVDCSAYQYVNINFESHYRKFHDSVFVEISTDSVVWDRYGVHAGLGVGDGTVNNPELVSINISASAGGQAAVYFRFHYEGEWDYAWMLDDVSFSETPDNAISFGSETFGGWWIGYLSTDDFGTDYTFYPMSQAQGNPYRFEGVISNIGVQTQNNVTMNVLVDDNVNTPVSFASTPLILVASERDTVATTNNFTPTEYGSHYLQFWASSDNTITDTVLRGTIVTDTVYGVDKDWNTDGANAGGGYFLGRYCGGQVLGNAFDIYADATVTSISFHVNKSSVPGAVLKVELYETDPSQTLANSPPVWYQESEDYTLTTADIYHVDPISGDTTGSWVTLMLKTPIIVSANTTWLAAVHGTQGFIGDTSLISSNSNNNSVSYLQDNCGTGTWGSLGNAMLIRMNFGLEATAVEEHKVEGKIEVYPNPSNGVFVLQITDVATNNTLSVTNVLGQTVYTESLSAQDSFSKELDLSSLEKGVYILRIENEYSSIAQQLVIE